MTCQGGEDIADGQFLQSCDKSGNCMEVFKYGEDLIPAAPFRMGRVADPRIHLPLLRDLQVREDDILLCAYMKAGTHWVWEIISMLTRGSAEYATEPKEDAMLEFRSVDKLDALASPRIFNTHLRLSNIPKGLIERKCKTVFVVRNPKDIAVSMYNHLSAKGSSLAYKGSFDDFLSIFMGNIDVTYNGFTITKMAEYFIKQNEYTLPEQLDFGFLTAFKVPHGAWPEYMTGWETDLALNPDIPRHIIYYEDLKQNAVHEIKKLASYLDVACTDSLIEEIADKCSFTKLKAGKTGNSENMRSNYLYRKGEVGEWKNWFTVAQNEEFNKFLQTKSKGSNFVYKYTI